MERDRSIPLDPYVRLSRIRLPPRVIDDKACLRPWMKDMRLGEPVIGESPDPLPTHAVRLAAAPKRAPPEFGDEEAEGRKRLTVCRHRMVVEVSGDDLSQPFSLSGNRLMHAPSQLHLDLPDLRPHAIHARIAPDLELALL